MYKCVAGNPIFDDPNKYEGKIILVRDSTNEDWVERVFVCIDNYCDGTVYDNMVFYTLDSNNQVHPKDEAEDYIECYSESAWEGFEQWNQAKPFKD